MKSVALFFFMLVSTCALAGDTKCFYCGSIWDNPERGYFWNPPPKPEKPEQKDASAPATANQKLSIENVNYKNVTKYLETFKEMKDLREAVEKLYEGAVMSGKQEDIKTYLAAQQFVENKATVFTDNYKRVLWKTPELDYNQRFPANNGGIKYGEAVRKKDKALTIEELSKKYALLFIFRGDCGVCHEMAPMVKYFQDNNSVEVMAISGDGGSLKGFPNAKRDNGIIKRLGVNGVPAFMLVERDSSEVTPVGYGYMSVDELEERIYTLMRMPVGASY